MTATKPSSAPTSDHTCSSLPAVQVIEAPTGTPATAVGALATPDLATVVMTLPPTTTEPAVVAAEILRALGKRTDVNGKARHNIDDIALVPVWLTAHRVNHLIVAAPLPVNLSALTPLAEMAAVSQATVTFACDHNTATAVISATQTTMPVRSPWPSLPTHPQLLAPSSASPAPAAWDPSAPTRLPHCEFLTFYATAERVLPPETFKQLSERYIDALERTLQWLERVIETDSLNEQVVRAGILELLAEQQNLDDVSTVVHAAEAAFFRHGWLLKVDRSELRSNLTRFPAPTVDPDVWNRVRAYREPARAATISLYLAGLNINNIEATTINDIAQWHHDPNTPVAGTTIPSEAGPYLRAQLLTHASEGHAPDEPFLPATTNRRIANDVRDAAGDLDLFIGDATLDRHSARDERRVSARAFKLEKL